MDPATCIAGDALGAVHLPETQHAWCLPSDTPQSSSRLRHVSKQCRSYEETRPSDMSLNGSCNCCLHGTPTRPSSQPQTQGRLPPTGGGGLVQLSELVTSFPVPTVHGYPNPTCTFAFPGLTQAGHTAWGNPAAPHSHTRILSLSFSPSFSSAGYPLGLSRARSGAVFPRTPSRTATFLSHLLSLWLFAALRPGDCACCPHRFWVLAQRDCVFICLTPGAQPGARWSFVGKGGSRTQASPRVPAPTGKKEGKKKAPRGALGFDAQAEVCLPLTPGGKPSWPGLPVASMTPLPPPEPVPPSPSHRCPCAQPRLSPWPHTGTSAGLRPHGKRAPGAGVSSVFCVNRRAL